LCLLCEDDLLKAMFEKELPMISMIAIATKPTIPNKLFLLRFKIFYIITTGIIMVIYGRLNVIVSSNTIFYNYCNIRQGTTLIISVQMIKDSISKRCGN